MSPQKQGHRGRLGGVAIHAQVVKARQLTAMIVEDLQSRFVQQRSLNQDSTHAHL